MSNSIGFFSILTLVGVFSLGLIVNSQEECKENCKNNEVEIACSKINTGVRNQYDTVDTKHRKFTKSFNDHFNLLQFDMQKLGELGVDNQEILTRLRDIKQKNNSLTTIYDGLSREIEKIRLSCGDGDITLQTIKFKSGIEDYDEFLEMIKADLSNLKTLIENV